MSTATPPTDSPNPAREVVITGLGVVCPLGIGREAFWRAIDAGNSTTVMTDQRGRPRGVHQISMPNQGDGSDIGAFEADSVITAVQVVGQDVRVQFMTASNYTYRVEYATALPTVDWNVLSGNFPGNGTVLWATNFGAASQPRRFYRVLQY